MTVWVVEFWGDHEIGGTDSVWSTRELAEKRALEQNGPPPYKPFEHQYEYGIVECVLDTDETRNLWLEYLSQDSSAVAPPPPNDARIGWRQMWTKRHHPSLR